MFAMIKMNEAEKEKKRADANLNLAEMRQEAAETAEGKAEQEAAHAIRQARMAEEARIALEEALKNCK